MRSYILTAALAVVASAHYHQDNESTVTDVETSTIYSCSSGAVSCPASTMNPSTPAAASITTIDVYTTTSICPESSTTTGPLPISNSTIIVPPPSSAPATSTPAAPTSSTVSIPAPPQTQSYTVIPITTCIPTTLYSTVPLQPSTPVVPTTASGGISGTGAGGGPTPSSSPIVPVTGAASAISGSFFAAGIMALAALFL